MEGKGMIHDSSKLFLRMHAGEAKDEKNGIVYELATNISQGTPMVHSDKTGKWFTLSWENIVDQAIAAGINEEEGT